MKNSNILELCFSPDLGGLELYMSKCSKELSAFFEITCVISTQSKLKKYLQGLEIFELPRKSSFSLSVAYKLSKIIDKNSIDIIHLHWTKDIPIAVLAKLISKKKPKIVQTRHMTMTRFKSDFYHRFLYKNIDTIICVTKALEEQIKKFIPSEIRPKTQTIYLGANDVKQYPQDELEVFKEQLHTQNSFIVGLVGRINEFKGQYLLVEAMKILRTKNLDIKGYIVGNPMDEEYLNSLKQKVQEYNLEDDLKFLGFLDDPNLFMQVCDVVLMTSKNETFGLVTIEAMKNETAVIGSNSGGVLEIIDDGQTGLLFQSGDANDLALKIEKLYQNSDLKDMIAKNAKQKVDQEFDHNKQYKKLIEFLKDL